MKTSAFVLFAILSFSNASFGEIAGSQPNTIVVSLPGVQAACMQISLGQYSGDFCCTGEDGDVNQGDGTQNNEVSNFQGVFNPASTLATDFQAFFGGEIQSSVPCIEYFPPTSGKGSSTGSGSSGSGSGSGGVAGSGSGSIAGSGGGSASGSGSGSGSSSGSGSHGSTGGNPEMPPPPVTLPSPPAAPVTHMNPPAQARGL